MMKENWRLSKNDVVLMSGFYVCRQDLQPWHIYKFYKTYEKIYIKYLQRPMSCRFKFFSSAWSVVILST